MSKGSQETEIPVPCFHAVRIKIDKRRCNGCETCVNLCPEVFRMWGEFLKADFKVLQPERFKDPIQKAVDSCPTSAIAVVPEVPPD